MLRGGEGRGWAGGGGCKRQLRRCCWKLGRLAVEALWQYCWMCVALLVGGGYANPALQPGAL